MIMMNRLPFHLITIILLRLPAKTVVCLKIVCKLWCNLISDDYFVNRHLEKSLATKSSLHYAVTIPRSYMQVYDDLPEPRQVTFPVHYSADFDSFGNLRELSHPFKDWSTGSRVLGSCRGLLLLFSRSHLLIYNPTTQTYNVLPSLQVHQARRKLGRFIYGFGYDYATRDFKCVRIKQRFDKEIGYLMCEVMVYSLSTNCWKMVPDFPSYSLPCSRSFVRICVRSAGVLVHETLHWIGTSNDKSNGFIVAFNLRDEMFSCLPLPNINFTAFREGLYVGMLDGSLCLIANCFFRCNVWVMKEYGVAESWRMMFTLSTHHFYDVERPISYSIDKRRLLVKLACDKLVYLDLETKKLTDLRLRLADCDKIMDAHVYVENLLVLNFSQFLDTVHC